MGYAFISYSSKNQISADAFNMLLKRNNVETWMAPYDIPAGSKYAQVINKAIKGCSCMVLLLTNDAQNSVWVAKEVERAINYHKTIIPVQLEKVILNDEFELYISNDHIISVQKIDETSEDIQKVLKSVILYTSTNTNDVPKKTDKSENTIKEDAQKDNLVNEQEEQLNKSFDEELLNEFAETTRNSQEGVPVSDLINGELPESFIGKCVDGLYEIKEIIETDSIGTTYRAYDNNLEETFAIKILNDECREKASVIKLSKQDRLFSRLTPHNNILSCYDLSISKKFTYYVTKYVESITLKEYIEFVMKNRTLSWKEGVYFARQIVSALNHAGSMNIVHYNLTAHSIQLMQDGCIKVGDLYIGPCGQISFEYDCPERFFGKKITEKSNIYSVGVIMYEMLTGQLPFKPSPLFSELNIKATQLPQRPSEINPEIPMELERIVMHALQPNPKNRYSSFEEMYKDLNIFFNS